MRSFPHLGHSIRLLDSDPLDSKQKQNDEPCPSFYFARDLLRKTRPPDD